MISAAQFNIITPQESKPVIVIKQDALVASYLMTRNNFELTRAQFSDICLKGSRLDGSHLWNPEKLKRIEKLTGNKTYKSQDHTGLRDHKHKNIKKQETKSIFTGRTLISLILPDNLNYEKKNNAHPDEPIVKIKEGVFLEGALDKNILGSANGSLIQILNKDYGPEITSNFIDNIQFVANGWLLVHGFSIGLGDCIVNNTLIDPIKDKLTECYTKAEGIKETTKNPGICEIRITACLSEARDVGMKIAKEAMSKDNNILVTVTAGAKGDMFNVSQIAGIMGQQNVEGKRIVPTLSHGKRTLPHYPIEIKDREREYESRGFVKNSFIHGLSPEEFWCHQISGREGVISTAMKTAETGYMERKTVKNCEDIKIYHDQTVRDANGRVIQFAYGENYLDSTKILKADGKPLICDVVRIANRLNSSYELEIPENLPNVMPPILPTIFEQEESLEQKQESIEKSKKIIDFIKDKFPSTRISDEWSLEQLQQRLEALKEEIEIEEEELYENVEEDEDEGENEGDDLDEDETDSMLGRDREEEGDKEDEENNEENNEQEWEEELEVEQGGIDLDFE